MPLQDLPEDVLLDIFERLHAYDILSLRQRHASEPYGTKRCQDMPGKAGFLYLVFKKRGSPLCPPTN
ncbi:hypothetical protein TRAPUB_6069 [Trametes pubescens]|uniref:F-box domain-containing protein n=1 Tax=Trametes pubescens TaxID=154538 RepID=A0A1M2V6S9_TRAPU|nr:hypothetical protein TRAPUB_6069 [Trametes pubescens]